jgi:uncharacterized protein (UPF0212 family)
MTIDAINGKPVTHDCPECGRECKSPHALLMHRMHAHQIRPEGKKKPTNPPKRLGRPPKSRSIKAEQSVEDIAKSIRVEEEPEFFEEKWPETVEPNSGLNYCPCCGTNLEVLARALAIAKGVGRG